MAESDVDPLRSMADDDDNRRPAAQRWTPTSIRMRARARRRRLRPTASTFDGTVPAMKPAWKNDGSMLCWIMLLVCCSMSCCLTSVGASYSEAEDLINDLDRPSKWIWRLFIVGVSCVLVCVYLEDLLGSKNRAYTFSKSIDNQCVIITFYINTLFKRKYRLGIYNQWLENYG